MSAAPMIEVEVVTKRFGATLALDEVSLSRRRGRGAGAAGAERRGQDYPGPRPDHAAVA